jgi:hypothetical protein
MKDITQAADKPMVDTTRGREDRIREAAYRRFIERGHLDGDELTDWIDAEAEIDAEDAGKRR